MRFGPSAVLFLVPLWGCGVAQEVVELPAGAIRAVIPGDKTDGPDIVSLQERLLRLADAFQTEATLALDRLQRGAAPLDPRALLEIKSALSAAVVSIASGANPRANLLDLTVFVTVSRLAVEGHWLPREFGDSARPLLQACRHGETQVWSMAAEILTADQQEELRAAILAWFGTRPNPESVFAARSTGFAADVLSAGAAEKAEASGRWIQLDPLSGLDPALREVARARLLAERALFVAQRLPREVRWHAELAALNLLGTPELKRTLADVDRLTATVERVGAVAEKLPDRVAKEREEILRALEGGLRPALAEAREALDAGTRLSQASAETLKVVDAFVARLDAGKDTTPAPPGAEPFRIRDYAETAVRLEAAVKQTTELVGALDRLLRSENLANLSRQVAPAVDRAEDAAKGIVDAVFWRAAALVGLVALAVLVCRWVSSRLPARAQGAPRQ
jgi:hypothetical protein